MKAPNTLSPVILNSNEVEAVCEALSSSGHQALANMIFAKSERSDTDIKFMEAAGKIDTSEIDVDERPVVSSSEYGAYVMVWQWISNEEAGVVRSCESPG